MSYYIDIIDTKNDQNKLVFEYARKSGIVLKWHGSDTKDEMAIVGSELQFQFGHNEKVDAKFINLFTGNETRFKVIVKKASNNVILWQGHVLPDLYSEPYTNGVTFTEFTATDGLGRLKGKYLPNDFYSKEKSLIEIYAAVLKLTGLTIDFVFNPAIENVVNKDWNTIYVDTADFIKKEKKQDAYKIFDTLLKDTLCICYQSDNVWHIEGINQRNLRKFTAKKYTINGVLVGNYNGQRLLKKITPLVEPTITIIPPYNQITVNHERVPQNFPKDITKQIPEGLSLQTGVVPVILGSKWMANGTCFSRCYHKEYYNRIYHRAHLVYILAGNSYYVNYPFDPLDYIDLKTKLFFYENQKIVIDFKLKAIDALNSQTPAVFNDDIIRYEILLNDVVVFSNFGTPEKPIQTVVFGKSVTAELTFDYIIPTNGLLNIKIYRPYGRLLETNALAFEVTKLEIEVLEFEDTQTVTDLINDEFTVDKEVDVTYADDHSAFSKGFRLYKLKDDNTKSFNEFTYLVAYQFIFNGKFYAVVSVEAAFVIKENLLNVKYYNPTTSAFEYLPINNVVLNFNKGEQMVIETPFVLPTNTNNVVEIKVKKYRILDVAGLRKEWVQWTDAVYKIENKSYLKTIANIYRRMFSLAHEKIEMTCLNAIKFNDFVWFKYVINKNFQIINCTWNLDDNKSSIILARTSYRDSGTNPNVENIPPIVLSESPLFLTATQTSIDVIATAYDPDGFISSQNWTNLLGAAGSIISSPTALNTQISNLTGNYYQYKIEATDNEGATGFAIVNIYRKINYLLTDVLLTDYDPDPNGASINRADGSVTLTIAPDVQVADILLVTGRIVFEFAGNDPSGNPRYNYEIYKNDVIIEEGANTELEFGSYFKTYDIAFSYVLGDEIKIRAFGNKNAAMEGIISCRVYIDTIPFTSGYGQVTNIPSSYLIYLINVN